MPPRISKISRIAIAKVLQIFQKKCRKYDPTFLLVLYSEHIFIKDEV
jgi:hypothetical protein